MQLSFLLVKLSWILAISYARTEEEGGPPRLYSHSPWILSHSRDWNGGAEEQGGPAWARHPVQPPAPPGRAPLGQGRGEGTRGPARTWRAARVAAGAAAARAGGRGWSRGARRGAWAARARRAAARKAASAPATCRRRPSGRCCSGTAPPSSRPRTGTRTPARSPGISSPRVSGAHRRQTGERRRLPGGAPGMPGPDCSRALRCPPRARGGPGGPGAGAGPGGDRPGWGGAWSAAQPRHAHAHRAPPARYTARCVSAATVLRRAANLRPAIAGAAAPTAAAGPPGPALSLWVLEPLAHAPVHSPLKKGNQWGPESGSGLLSIPVSILWA